MTTRFQKNSQMKSNVDMSKQRRWPAREEEPVADLPELMNDWFFGTMKTDPNERRKKEDDDGVRVKREENGGGKTRTSKLTQEWLDDAKRLVASSPARHSSPARVVGFPKYASSPKEAPRLGDRRDPLSRSARRHRSGEGISDEILSRTARYTRNNSECFVPDSPAVLHSASSAPAAAVDLHSSDDPDGPDNPSRLLPPRQSSSRKSRFQGDSPEEPNVPPRRAFRRSPAPPSPTKRQQNQKLLLSPPKNLVESAHRRSISSSTCSQDKLSRGPDAGKGYNSRRSVSAPAPAEPADHRPEELTAGDDVSEVNSFLRRQRSAIARIAGGEVSAKARIILSGSSTSTTSSMVAAICYAWLVENTDNGGGVVVPVVNMKRARMWKHRQAAWLFYHLGVDASALLFADEVDLDGLLSSRQLNILVVGQDVLKTNSEVGSQCTVLTDNFCEDAYNLLQTSNLKKLLLAGILLDTQNLDSTAKFFTSRDAEAVQLLLVSSAASYRYELYEQLMQDHKDSLFLEVLKRSYGKTFSEENDENGVSQENRRSSRKLASISQEVNMPNSAVKQKLTLAPAPANALEKAKQKPSPVRARSALAPGKAPETVKQKPSPTRAAAPVASPKKDLVAASPAKNKKFSLGKLFGFGSK